MVGWDVLRELDRFVCKALRGDFPRAVTEVFCAARLTPLRKVGHAGEGTRPVAAGEVLRRVVGKALMAQPQVRRSLRGLDGQCGVGVAGACVVAPMGLQRVVDAMHEGGSGSWGVLQVDFSNAFNCLRRRDMLDAVRRRCPEALPWMAACYAEHSPLFCGGRVLRSESGLQQGDPCGPAGFAWGLHDVVEALGDSVEWQCWYLDDGTLVGSRPQLLEAFRRLRDMAADRGIEVNVGKCRLWGPAFMVPGGGVVGLAGNGLDGIPVVPYVPGSGLKALGVPVCHPGGDGFAGRVWAERVDGVERLLGLVRLLPQAHVQYTLLRVCLDACRVNDLLRGCALGQAVDEFARLSASLRKVLGDIVGVALMESQWGQATLPIRCGGLGLRDPVEERFAARMSAVVDFVSRGSEEVGLERGVAVLPRDTAACVSRGVEVLGRVSPLEEWSGDVSSMLEAERPLASQRWWSERVAAGRVEVQKGMGTSRDRVRFGCQQRPHAGAWLAAVPSVPKKTLIPNGQFRGLVRWWLGAPLRASGLGQGCPRCGTPMDLLGDHAVCCRFNNITRRHMALQDGLVDVARRADVACRKEAGGGEEERTRPGDVFFPRWDTEGPAAVDVTVRHPLAPSAPVGDLEGLERWRGRQEGEKRAKYGAQCGRLGWRFIPFVVDTFGGISQEGLDCVGRLLKGVVGQKEGWQRRGVEAEVWQALLMGVMREVGRQLTLGVGAEEEEEEAGSVEGESHQPYALGGRGPGRGQPGGGQVQLPTGVVMFPPAGRGGGPPAGLEGGGIARGAGRQPGEPSSP